MPQQQPEKGGAGWRERGGRCKEEGGLVPIARSLSGCQPILQADHRAGSHFHGWSVVGLPPNLRLAMKAVHCMTSLPIGSKGRGCMTDSSHSQSSKAGGSSHPATPAAPLFPSPPLEGYAPELHRPQALLAPQREPASYFW